MFLKSLIAILALVSFTAQAGTGKGYFNEKGEVVYTFKNGQAQEVARKPASLKPDPTTPLYFQEDDLARCYYVYSSSNIILECVKK